jgi:hypothetical protein
VIRSSNKKQEINSFRGKYASPLVFLPAGIFVLDWVCKRKLSPG